MHPQTSISSDIYILRHLCILRHLYILSTFMHPQHIYTSSAHLGIRKKKSTENEKKGLLNSRITGKKVVGFRYSPHLIISHV